jgi:hypothetical protein
VDLEDVEHRSNWAVVPPARASLLRCTAGTDARWPAGQLTPRPCGGPPVPSVWRSVRRVCGSNAPDHLDAGTVCVRRMRFGCAVRAPAGNLAERRPAP